MVQTHAAAALTVLVIAASVEANAFTFTSGGVGSIDSGTTSSVNGATTVTFESGLPTNTFAGGLVVNYNGGAIVQGNAGGFNVAPNGDLSKYWAIGATHGEQGVMTFSQPLSYFGFDWSTPDSYNSVTLMRGDTVLFSFTGDKPTNERYLNIFADNPGEFFDKVVFDSNQNAFESDNHAFKIGVVPEPSTYAMMVAGLLAVGAVARRRRS